jgi:hypothetical protein
VKVETVEDCWDLIDGGLREGIAVAEKDRAFQREILKEKVLELKATIEGSGGGDSLCLGQIKLTISTSCVTCKFSSVGAAHELDPVKTSFATREGINLQSRQMYILLYKATHED